MSDFDPQHIASLCGYVDFPTRPAITATLGPPLSQSSPHLMQATGDQTPVFLYRAYKDALGKDEPDYPPQKTGDCTSFGSAHIVDLTQCVQMVLGHAAESFKEICSEAIYGMGREIGGMLGGGAGCFGSAVSKAVMAGCVPREVVGAYSGQRADQWGRSGVPSDIKDKAKAHPVKATAMISTCDEGQAALQNGYGFIVCSNQGFTMQRDENGACRPQGSWAHCMSCSGVRWKDGQRQFLIMQSWGPNVPSGPRTDGQPSYSFWIADSVLERMLAGRDSFAFSGFDGFPGQPLPGNWTYAGLA